MKRLIGALALVTLLSLAFIQIPLPGPIKVVIKDGSGPIGDPIPLNLLITEPKTGLAGIIVQIQLSNKDFQLVDCPLCTFPPQRISTNVYEFHMFDAYKQWEPNQGNFEISLAHYRSRDGIKRKPKIVFIRIDDDNGYQYPITTYTGWLIPTGPNLQ